jgi:hypothetical protein
LAPSPHMCCPVAGGNGADHGAVSHGASAVSSVRSPASGGRLREVDVVELDSSDAEGGIGRRRESEAGAGPPEAGTAAGDATAPSGTDAPTCATAVTGAAAQATQEAAVEAGRGAAAEVEGAVPDAGAEEPGGPGAEEDLHPVKRRRTSV